MSSTAVASYSTIADLPRPSAGCRACSAGRPPSPAADRRAGPRLGRAAPGILIPCGPCGRPRACARRPSSTPPPRKAMAQRALAEIYAWRRRRTPRRAASGPRALALFPQYPASNKPNTAAKRPGCQRPAKAVKRALTRPWTGTAPAGSGAARGAACAARAAMGLVRQEQEPEPRLGVSAVGWALAIITSLAPIERRARGLDPFDRREEVGRRPSSISCSSRDHATFGWSKGWSLCGFGGGRGAGAGAVASSSRSLCCPICCNRCRTSQRWRMAPAETSDGVCCAVHDNKVALANRYMVPKRSQISCAMNYSAHNCSD